METQVTFTRQSTTWARHELRAEGANRTAIANGRTVGVLPF
jgi:hypothetical protein